jgi:ABC-type antimicrobial peptide transport system permease subunit
MRERGLEYDSTMVVYLPYYGTPWTPIQYVIHTAGTPEAIVPALRGVLAEINPNIPLSNVRNLDEILSGSLAARRFNTLLLGIFAGVALVLAMVGIYGVLAYTVARRTSEIGVRMALGANSRSILGLIVLQGMRPILLGMAAGLISAFGLSRLLTRLLFGVTPGDPLTYVGVALLVAAAALVSCLIPARQALRIDPVEALRIE